MAFLIDEAYAPAVLTAPPIGEQEFAEFCSEYPDVFLETTVEGDLIVMAPAFSPKGVQNAEKSRPIVLFR